MREGAEGSKLGLSWGSIPANASATEEDTKNLWAEVWTRRLRMVDCDFRFI